MNFVSATAGDKLLVWRKQRNRAAFNGHNWISSQVQRHNNGPVSAGEGIPRLSGHLGCSQPALGLLPFPTPDWSLQRQEQRESKDMGSARLQIVTGTRAKSKASPENV